MFFFLALPALGEELTQTLIALETVFSLRK